MPAMPYRVIGTINRYRCTCTRCGHTWEATGEEPPKACADCKSRYWNVVPGKLKRGRPPKPRR
jgi:predicted  nucleic acid-binding Zn-ribbon protein